MAALTLELLFVLILLLANGAFAMAETALVASRKTRLKTLFEEGNKGAGLALQLAESPTRFLSTVQVGITFVGVLASAIAGANLSDKLASSIETIPALAPYSHYLALTTVVLTITYLTIVLGELAPKRIALTNPEGIASGLAGSMLQFEKAFASLIHLLNISSDLILALLRIKKPLEATVSEEEVRGLIDEGLTAGVFKKTEKDMVDGVFALDNLTAQDLMTPRARIVWLCATNTNDQNWRTIARSGHSHFPVYAENRDNVLGLVSIKSLWANLSLAGEVELKALVTPPLYIPTSMPSGKLIEEFRKSKHHIALVVDEFGSLQGLVTLNDLMMAIVGNLPEREQRHHPKARRRGDGTWVIDAMLDIVEMKETLGILEPLPAEEENQYTTLGGFLLHQFGRIPTEGEQTLWEDYQFEVLDMDKTRIDKVLVTKLPQQEPPKKDAY